MARFYGKVGYMTTVESSPSVYEEKTIVHEYCGDVIKATSSWSSASQENDNLKISNQISIVADPFALSNFQSIRFVEWMGVKWKVSNVSLEFPRLILTIGDVYNGEIEQDCT